MIKNDWNWIWKKFEKYLSDPILEQVFTEWSVKNGQAQLLLVILKDYINIEKSEWHRFLRAFNRWYKKASEKPIRPTWTTQKEWIQNYFDKR